MAEELSASSQTGNVKLQYLGVLIRAAERTKRIGSTNQQAIV